MGIVEYFLAYDRIQYITFGVELHSNSLLNKELLKVSNVSLDFM